MLCYHCICLQCFLWLQVIFLWLLLLWILLVWVGPLTIRFYRLNPDNLSTTAQALVHLGVDVGQLVVTIAILWRKLKKYRPRRLGWFNTRLWPVQHWLVPVIFAAVAFPLFDAIASQAQVAHWLLLAFLHCAK